MSVRYDSIKSMRVAKIGTIMPWSGDGGTGNLESNIPKGWITCKGQQDLFAKDYPLLAAELGDTYGGDMTVGSPTFPYQNTTNVFGLPNLSSHAMIDIESYHLGVTKYQMGQPDCAQKLKDESGNDLIKDLGQTTQIVSTHSATAALEFTLNLPGSLYVKFAGIQLSPPDFSQSVYTLNRKLGLNHLPRHRHSDAIPSANLRGSGAQPFYAPTQQIRMYGDAQPDICQGVTRNPTTCGLRTGLNMPSWANGRHEITYYGSSDMEDTLPQMNEFKEYISDSDAKNYWSSVPAGDSQWKKTHLGTARTTTNNDDRGSGHKNPTYTQTLYENGVTAEIQNTIPLDTHKQPCYTGLFPRPNDKGGKPNFYGYTAEPNTPVTKGGVTDHPEALTNGSGAPFFVNNVPLTSGSNEITLPAGTDIRQQYGTSPNQWYQWDKIVPLMYVTVSSADDKYKYIPEGARVQTIERLTNGQYKVTLNKSILASVTTEIKFRHGSWGTSLNAIADLKNPLKAAFKYHNHDSFEIQQTTGSMPTQPGTFLTSYTASNANGNALQPETIPNALNIAVDTAQPALTTTFIIKAF